MAHSFSTQLFLVLSIFGTPQLMTGGETGQALATLRALASQMLLVSHPAQEESLGSEIRQTLDRLEAATVKASETLVDRSGERLQEYEAQSAALFGQRPRLPAENKHGGKWRFEPIIFKSKAEHLFIHALTFKASRTIRLQRILLHFADGTTRAFEYPDPQGKSNGRPFEKRKYLPWLRILDQRGLPEVGQFRAIEIWGSAQDGNFNAVLDFKLQIPSYHANSPQKALSLIAKLRRDWQTPQQAIKQWRETMANLEALDAVFAEPGL